MLMLFRDSGAVGRLPVLVPVHFENDFPVFGVDGKVEDKLLLEDTNRLTNMHHYMEMKIFLLFIITGSGIMCRMTAGGNF